MGRYRITLEENVLSVPDHGPESFTFEELLQLKGDPKAVIGICEAIISRMEEVIDANLAPAPKARTISLELRDSERGSMEVSRTLTP